MEETRQKVEQIMKGIKAGEQEERPEAKAKPIKNIEDDLVTQLANLSIGIKGQYSQSEKLQGEQQEQAKQLADMVATLGGLKAELTELAKGINKHLIIIDKQIGELSKQGKVNQESLTKYEAAGERLSKQWVGDNAELIKSSNKMFDNIYLYTGIMILIVHIGCFITWNFWVKPEFSDLYNKLGQIERILTQKNSATDKLVTEGDKVPAKGAHKR